MFYIYMIIDKLINNMKLRGFIRDFKPQTPSKNVVQPKDNSVYEDLKTAEKFLSSYFGNSSKHINKI